MQNNAGPGPYSDNSVPIAAQRAPCAPRIDLNMLVRDVIAFAGEPAKVGTKKIGKEEKWRIRSLSRLQIHIPYHASPVPEVTWARAGTDISMDSRVSQETSEFMTQLNFSKCQLSDSGVYTITLTNAMGTDSSNVRLRVVDRPGPPEGPLLITEITPDSCVLTWKSPKEDGGSPVTNYIVERCLIRSGQEPRWERVTSFVRTTRYEVHGLHENEQYKFRIRAENQYGVSEPLENTEPITAKYQFNVPGQPGAPEPMDMDTTWVQLKWSVVRNRFASHSYRCCFRDPPSSDGGSKILGRPFVS